MIKFLMLAVALSFSASAADKAKQDESVVDVCQAHAKLAKRIMTSRQDGTEMSSLLEMIEKLPDDSAKRTAQAIIMMAYDESAYSAEKNQQKAITEFSNKIMLTCLKLRQ